MVPGSGSTRSAPGPYAKRGVINSTFYTQLNVVKTAEQILGIPTMNQEDRAAEPMFNAFTNIANLTPYNYLPNQIPLTSGLTSTGTKNASKTGATYVNYVPDTAAQPGIPASEQAIYTQWVTWESEQHFGGAAPDRGLRQPRAAQPVRLVQLARLEDALPR